METKPPVCASLKAPYLTKFTLSDVHKHLSLSTALLWPEWNAGDVTFPLKPLRCAWAIVRVRVKLNRNIDASCCCCCCFVIMPVFGAAQLTQPQWDFADSEFLSNRRWATWPTCVWKLGGSIQTTRRHLWILSVWHRSLCLHTQKWPLRVSHVTVTWPSAVVMRHCPTQPKSLWVWLTCRRDLKVPCASLSTM